LNWVTQGKTNPEIAIILNISVKTVGHHIEHIMSKLGVERRGGAALWAQQTLALCL
jgi:DNA-binding CsgD family transcriptional regulator